MGKPIHSEEREKDVQAICDKIKSMSVANGGDYYDYCPFCLADGRYADYLSEMQHEHDCIYLIAKDLSTNP